MTYPADSQVVLGRQARLDSADPAATKGVPITFRHVRVRSRARPRIAVRGVGMPAENSVIEPAD
jgi:hypothetical protein